MDNRKVFLPNGREVTFTQRGQLPCDGFVRIDGKTISGFRTAVNRFYPWRYGKNSDLVYAHLRAAA